MASVATNPEHYLWVEKYRPNIIDDCVLPEKIKSEFKGFVKQGRIPTLLLSGGPGSGKTTAARCLANEVDADFMVLNASMEGGIDVIRTKILQFASTVSFGSNKKITLLDESDFLSGNVQGALRNFIEQFSDNHSIIFTANYKNKITDALQSRSHVIDFKIPVKEKATLASQFFKRVLFILNEEKIEFDKKVVAEVVNHYFPDFRRCLNELQKHSAGGAIDSSILTEFSDATFGELIESLKAKKFNNMRKWVGNHSDVEPSQLFRMFYDYANEKVDAKSIPALVLLLGEYQYKASFVVDQEINLAAFLTEVMLSPNIQFK